MGEGVCSAPHGAIPEGPGGQPLKVRRARVADSRTGRDPAQGPRPGTSAERAPPYILQVRSPTSSRFPQTRRRPVGPRRLLRPRGKLPRPEARPPRHPPCCPPSEGAANCRADAGLSTFCRDEGQQGPPSCFHFSRVNEIFMTAIF